MIEKGRAWLKVHQQVKIAVRAGLSPSDRAEHGDPMSPALPRDAEDFRAAAPQLFQGQHLIGHSSRVSPLASTTLRTKVRRPSGTRAGSEAPTAARGQSSRIADAAPRQVLANRGHVSARLALLKPRQALRDARDRVGVTEDFQGHLHALKVVHRQQDSLGALRGALG